MAEVQPYQFEPIFAPGETSESENSDQSDEDQPEKYARHQDEAVSWCSCGKCAVPETEKECLCCREIKIIDESVRNSDFSCITDLNQFKTVCLDSTVLRTALVGMVEMGFQPVPPEPIPHRYAMQFLQVY